MKNSPIAYFSQCELCSLWQFVSVRCKAIAWLDTNCFMRNKAKVNEVHLAEMGDLYGKEK